MRERVIAPHGHSGVEHRDREELDAFLSAAILDVRRSVSQPHGCASRTQTSELSQRN